MSPITPGSRSPPSPGDQLNLDPFSQLSINPVYTHPNTGNGVSTPPKSPAQSSYTASIGANDYRYQHQPMVVSPENANTSGSLVPTGQNPNDYNYQYNAPSGGSQYGGIMNNQSANQIYPQQQQQQQFFGQQSYNQQPNGMTPTQTNPVPNFDPNSAQNNAQKQNNGARFSPPVSPLWAPSSPNGGQAPNNNPEQFSGVPPSMPNGSQKQWEGSAIPTLPTSNINPFDELFGADSNANQAAPANNGASSAPANNAQDEADFWADMGFGVEGSKPNNNANNPAAVSQSNNATSGLSADSSNEGCQEEKISIQVDERGLPAGGEYYNARVTTAMLGAIFSSAKELRSTLFSATTDEFVNIIGERPVVSFTIDGSAADTAGIGLGHVLLKVNGSEVRETDDAVKLVGQSKRPLIMEFYIPPKLKVVKTEGQYMVKYDTNTTEAPASHVEWKPKYVVAGDMLGKPYILYMYRSKAEYDIAVKESQVPGKSLSVKVKQFDIRGARIFHERGQVRYPNQPTWYYFTVVRSHGLPIKIAAKSSEDLTPIYDGIMGFLEREATQRKNALQERRDRMAAMYRETYY